MTNKMLIDASHQEETRVVVVRDNRIEEYDYESEHKKQIKGNIYLARVTRVEPSLQAAFVEYGGNRQGFLAFSEIHPDYYQIPLADRQALLEEEQKKASIEAEETNDPQTTAKKSSRKKTSKNKTIAQTQEETSISEKLEDDTAETSEDIVSLGAEDDLEEVTVSPSAKRLQYKIQEVIKRRQILLVQVTKEERGNKGAALTTYLSLAGRYSVLMPNAARGGGISRKITDNQDRNRLKEIVKSLEIPETMGIILRTAGAKRTKAEIKRDYDYLMRLWNNVRDLTLNSIAPALVYEEGSLIKRSIRDLYDKTIDEIWVAGDNGYKEAKSFMRMLMPSHTKVVQPYRDHVPIFVRHGIEAELDKMILPEVKLKSGGSLVINQTEALVAIDVNSGKSTKENSIEETAYQTNLEAAYEIALQLRLRDLAGLVVIDFIDMEDKKNIRAVERKLKDCLKNDRARIQVGSISHFGLLEMSRQRIRSSVLESTMLPCPECSGTGQIRSDSSIALHIIRSIEEFLLHNNKHNICVKTSISNALSVLNYKRAILTDLEKRFGLFIHIEADKSMSAQRFVIEKHSLAENIVAPINETISPDNNSKATANIPALTEKKEDETTEATKSQRRRRRGKRGGRRHKENDFAQHTTVETISEVPKIPVEEKVENTNQSNKKKRTQNNIKNKKVASDKKQPSEEKQENSATILQEEPIKQEKTRRPKTNKSKKTNTEQKSEILKVEENQKINSNKKQSNEAGQTRSKKNNKKESIQATETASQNTNEVNEKPKRTVRRRKTKKDEI